METDDEFEDHDDEQDRDADIPTTRIDLRKTLGERHSHVERLAGDGDGLGMPRLFPDTDGRPVHVALEPVQPATSA